MYRYLKGRIVEKHPTEVVLEVAGVGYLLRVPLTTSAALPDLPGQGETTLHTVLVHREDEICLYGFASAEARALFCRLTRVTGIGPQTALMILSGGPVDEIRQAIRRRNSVWLKSIRGVGEKTCQRIFLELGSEFPEGAESASGPAAEDAVGALVSLGYDRREAEKRVAATLRSLGADAPLTRLIQEAVRAKIRN